jgi:hypothetical protein
MGSPADRHSFYTMGQGRPVNKLYNTALCMTLVPLELAILGNWGPFGNDSTYCDGVQLQPFA